MTNILRNGVLAAGAAALLAAGAADAQPTKESLNCSSAKLKAYGKDVGAKIKCYAKAAGTDDPLDPLCLSKAETKTTQAFDKAELKGGCPTDGNPNGDITNTLARLNAYVGAVNTALAPTTPPSKCQSKKLGAAGKLAAALFNCESKAAKKNIAVDQVKCVQKSIDKLVAAFGKEEAKAGNDCTTTGDATAQVGEAQDMVRIQTVYTPRFDGCGNDLVLAPETCDDGNVDDGDFCPSDCIVDFCSPVPSSSRTVTVVTSTPDLAAITLLLDYPEGKVSLPGTCGDIPSGIITPVAGTAQGNDFDHALRYVQFDVFNFGTTDIATLAFEDCSGATVPAPGEFSCTVIDAGAEDGLGGFVPVLGATCSVTVAP
jgi:cysteine-rich repeat protein